MAKRYNPQFKAAAIKQVLEKASGKTSKASLAHWALVNPPRQMTGDRPLKQ